MGPRLLLPALSLVLAAQDPKAVDRIRQDVLALASPQMEGRGNGEPGLNRAAAYLQGRLRAAGLRPELRTFPLTLAPEVLKVEVALGSLTLQRGQDFDVMGWSGEGRFMGHSTLRLPTGLRVHALDETAGLSLEGRVLLIPRSVPESAAPGTTALERSLVQRLKRLEELHPAAVLVLEDEGPRPFQREEGPASFGMPILSVRKDLAWGGPFDLTLTLRPRTADLPNLVAEVPGSGGLYAAERIVLGAHMDHLGRGSHHSLGGETARGQVHAGADDNASGSAVVTELGRRFSKRPLRRSVVIALFGGEEEGLLGSRAFLDHPSVPLKSLRFMANFDMVGRLDAAAPTLHLGAYGAPESELRRAKALAPRGWTVTGDLGASVGGSDHMTFAAANIPTLFFFTGLHSDYHRPTDTPEKLNVDGMARLADYAEALLRDLDAQDALPAFDPSTAKTQGAVSPLKVSFGTIPDYGTHPDGFRINGVSKGGAAEAAGLQGGDVITHIAGRAVKDVYGYMAVLGDLKAGVPVKVRFLRNGHAQEVDVTPKGRN